MEQPVVTMEEINDNLVLIGGESGSGKSASLMYLNDPENVVYLNCESGKKLPFRSKFRQVKVTDPMKVKTILDAVEAKPERHTVIIDTATFLMDMFEAKYIFNVEDSMAGWAQYQHFFRRLMQYYVARSNKNFIITAHIMNILNEAEHVMQTKVPIKGALKNNGIEAFFSTVVNCKKMPLGELEPYQNDLLTITDDDKIVGYKHCFQTRLTSDTIRERIRSPIGMWEVAETYIDNNAQFLLDRLHEYYGTAPTTATT